MYAQYFKLKELPFVIEPNPRFIVLGKDHKEALAMMLYAIEQQEGWALVVGDPGLGKTTLTLALLRALKENVAAVLINNPRLEPLDFFNLTALELGLGGPFSSKGDFLTAFRKAIKDYREQGKVILLVVDEAQALSPHMLEELRLLGNLDDSTPRVFNLFLVGQPELKDKLKSEESKGLLQRLRRYHELKPLSSEESLAYIKYRLKVADGGSEEVFDPGALGLVHVISGGNPRLINSLCDNSMLLAFAKQSSRVDASLVLEAARGDPILGPVVQSLSPVTITAAQRRSRVYESGRTEAPKQAAPKAETVDKVAAKPREAVTLSPGPEAEAKASRPQAGVLRGSKERPARPDLSKGLRRRQKAGAGSRFAESLSQKSPGSLTRRLVVLVVVFGLVGGGYFFHAAGGFDYVTSVYRSLIKGQPQLFAVPEEKPVQTSAKAIVKEASPPQEGIQDWGPIVTAPAASAPSKGENHG
ncbi:MAG: AAA family ATPase [Desulfarculaceae bacterium]|jgi:general secretion pathway protein A